MAKDPLKILVIDRPWRQGEKCCQVFEEYGQKGYDVIIFPFTETKRKTEVIFFSHYKYHDIFQELFCIRIPYDLDGGDPFYDFDLEEIEEQTFYDILDQKFEVSTSKLTEIEKVRGVSLVSRSPAPPYIPTPRDEWVEY